MTVIGSLSMQNRTVRQSPSGPALGKFGYARLTLSAPAPFVDGVPLPVPYDEVVMSEGFGEIVDDGFVAGTGSFRLTQSGIYLMTATVGLSIAPTTGASLLVSEGVVNGGGIAVGAGGSALLSAVGSFEIDADASPGNILTALLSNAGNSGNINFASALILQVG